MSFEREVEQRGGDEVGGFEDLEVRWERLTLAVAVGLLSRAEVTATLRELLDSAAGHTKPKNRVM